MRNLALLATTLCAVLAWLIGSLIVAMGNYIFGLAFVAIGVFLLWVAMKKAAPTIQ